MISRGERRARKGIRIFNLPGTFGDPRIQSGAGFASLSN